MSTALKNVVSDLKCSILCGTKDDGTKGAAADVWGLSTWPHTANRGRESENED